MLRICDAFQHSIEDVGTQTYVLSRATVGDSAMPMSAVQLYALRGTRFVLVTNVRATCSRIVVWPGSPCSHTRPGYSAVSAVFVCSSGTYAPIAPDSHVAEHLNPRRKNSLPHTRSIFWMGMYSSGPSVSVRVATSTMLLPCARTHGPPRPTKACRKRSAETKRACISQEGNHV